MTRLLAALACCGLLSLAACTKDASSTADPPTPSPAVSTSAASPSPTPSPQPESPEAFVRRWVEADTHMQNTGDGDEYRELSKKCSSCLEYADRIEGIYRDGGYVKTHGWIILRSHVSPPLDNGQLIVTIRVDSTPTEYVEEAGGRVTHLDGARVSYRITLNPEAASWLTINAEQVAQ